MKFIIYLTIFLAIIFQAALTLSLNTNEAASASAAEPIKKSLAFCDVSKYNALKGLSNYEGSKAKRMGDMSRDLAKGKGVKKTTYSYQVHIDGKAGIYFTSCSCFVSYIVKQVSPAALKEIPLDKCVNPPSARANMWSDFYKSLSTTNKKSKHWKGVPKIADAKHGDVLSWGFHVNEQCVIAEGHHDTGHVMFIVKGPRGEKPVRISKEKKWAFVWVADASNLKHIPGHDFGARYSDKAVVNKNHTDFKGLKLGKTAGKSATSGIGMGVVKLGLKKNGEPNGKFVLQKKEVSGATVAIGRIK